MTGGRAYGTDLWWCLAWGNLWVPLYDHDADETVKRQRGSLGTLCGGPYMNGGVRVTWVV